MKKTIKISLYIVLTLIITGCGMSAKKTVESYLNKYNTLNPEVLNSMDSIIENENLNEENAHIYEDVFKKQYTDLLYKVTDEKYDGNEATISVKIKVYDLYKVQKETSNYLATHPDEFNSTKWGHFYEKGLK